jgi:hypothetical protein
LHREWVNGAWKPTLEGEEEEEVKEKENEVFFFLFLISCFYVKLG